MHVVVTGGSSGIGLEVARLYAARGYRLTLIARDAPRLEKAREELITTGQVSDVDIHIATVDVGEDADLSAAVAAAEAALGPCDVLVTSAGIVEPGSFETLSSEAFAAQVTTNLMGTANAVRAIYKGMKSRGEGRIMIVSSGAALIGIYGYAAYCASKAALTGFAEALGMEAAGSGVRISICYPPDTITPQFEREMLTRPREAKIVMGAALPWTAKAVAERIVRGIDRGTPRIYFGFSITGLGLFGSLIKPLLFWWYQRRF
ncbi:3-dehydrosphinganine reductase [Rhizobium sp. CF080]|nr:SDR family oxidoreductase [Rhizobium sp. CF080]EUB94936.1 3-dehydrosphinganine reductase [Rhizobium sp. CF080]